MDQFNWIRINETKLLDKRTKIIYPIYSVKFDADKQKIIGFTIKDFRQGIIMASNLLVLGKDVENIKLTDQSVGLLYDAN